MQSAKTKKRRMGTCMGVGSDKKKCTPAHEQRQGAWVAKEKKRKKKICTEDMEQRGMGTSKRAGSKRKKVQSA